MAPIDLNVPVDANIEGVTEPKVTTSKEVTQEIKGMTNNCISCALNRKYEGVCCICRSNLHFVNECSLTEENEHGKEIRFCMTCSQLTKSEKSELLSGKEFENWRGLGQSKSTQKRSSYLKKNSEWLHIDLSCGKKYIPIGVLKNGSRTILQPVKVNKRKYVTTNTCAFDSVVQILCSAYCDSDDYKKPCPQNFNHLASS